jgi:ubiquinone/menaquinone biosynthesis C-methylase UbiE
VLTKIQGSLPEKVLDLGCGKGRYSKIIAKTFPSITVHCCDISKNVMAKIPENIIKNIGSLIRTPYQVSEFDFLIVIESLEHAVNIEAALREIHRILMPGGTLVIVDKNIGKLGSLKLPDWEQWFDPQKIALSLQGLGFETEIDFNVSYENRQDGLFFAVTAKKLQ